MIPVSPPSILIVDDEPKNIQLLANLLRDAGYIIEYATSGPMALQWLQMRPFDMVLLDILMPGKDGFEVCAQIKNNPMSAHIPVIFLSARTDTPSLVNGFALGAADYVSKPFHKEELLARVGAHITLARQQAQLSQSAHQLEIENRNKDKLISILAHDLRNPIIGILDFARLLQQVDRLSPETLQNLAVEFHVSAEHMLALVDNLLTWSRAQRGMLVHRPAENNLHMAVQARLGLLSVGAIQKRIKITNLVNKQLITWSDPDMLGTVLDNLLSNAVKFTRPGGQIMIRASNHTGLIQIDVEDNGIGIASDEIAKLFIPGLVRHRQGTSEEKGTGLGLALCKEFVELNGGTIWVKSTDGQGSCFSFTVPAGPEN